MNEMFRYGAGVTVPMDEMNVGKLADGDPRREQIVAALDTKIARLTEASRSTPLRLSPAALATFGIVERPEQTEAAE